MIWIKRGNGYLDTDTLKEECTNIFHMAQRNGKVIFKEDCIYCQNTPKLRIGSFTVTGTEYTNACPVYMELHHGIEPVATVKIRERMSTNQMRDMMIQKK